MTLPPQLQPATTGNPCPAGWRDVEHGERIADPHACIGAVVGLLRRDGVDVDMTDEVHAAAVAAMTDLLRVLDVASAPDMRYEALYVA